MNAMNGINLLPYTCARESIKEVCVLYRSYRSCFEGCLS
jgi:hypothetical protein